MDLETLRVTDEPLDVGGRLVTITLHRPEVRNAINLQMIKDLGAALDALAEVDDLRAVILTGAGDKAFAGGADIAELRERRLPEALQRINAALFRKLEEQPAPTIAAIRGFALGGGCELAMACDIRIAGRSARFGQPEVSLGIIAGAGALQRLPRLVGFGRAKELVMSGRIIDADEAERIGLVNRVVDDAAVLDEARALARTIAGHAPLAVRLSKAALNVNAGTSIPSDMVDAFGQAILFESADKQARMTAFLEKKSAKEKNR